MLAVIQDEWARRPWWMNLMFALCIYMAFVRVPIDLVFTSIEHDQEAWFGIVLRGNAGLGAMLGAVFLLPTIALWRSRPIFGRPA